MKDKFLSFKYLDYIVLFVISIAVYLPLAHNLGYIKDDWYLMYDAYSQGPSIFREIFSIDRPARGTLLEILYPLFGNDPYYYSISAWGFRFLSAIGFLWIVRLIWPEQRMPTLFISMLFLIYPGYLSQINAIDFQAHTVSLCLAMFSIALSIKAITKIRTPFGISLTLVSILFGWGYLALVEYSIGLEVFRFIAISVTVLRTSDKNIVGKTKKILNQALVFFIIPLGFLLWRVFIFQNERKATDFLVQVGQFFTSPLTGLWGAVHLLQDVLNVTILAWAVPLYKIGFQLRLRETLIGIALSLAILVFIWFIYERKLFREDSDDEIWRKEAFWIGIISVVTSLLPVTLVNRFVTFEEYSRYGLPAATGGVILIGSLIFYLTSSRIRMLFAYVLFFIAITTHYANAVTAVTAATSVREFWWQVSWRIPQIEKGTTLIVNYAESGISEDYVVWGPANIIYFPEKHSERPVELSLSSTILDNTSITNIISGTNGHDKIARSNLQSISYNDILIISQPSRESCVHVYSSDFQEFSTVEDARIIIIAPKSQISNVLLGTEFKSPPESIFGPEPTHNWCYYYQKADLARQQGNWREIVELDKIVEKLSLHPNDQIELIPFVQAYAYIGDMKKVRQLSTRINTESFYEKQACQILGEMGEHGYPLSDEMQAQVDELFCNRK